MAERIWLAAIPSRIPATDPQASNTSIRPSAAQRICFPRAPRATRILSSRKRLPTVDLDEVVASQDIGLALNDAGPEIADLRRAILALPDEYREPIVLQVLGGFSTGEIAKELGLTVPAVLTRLFRARNKLREMYGLGAVSPEEAP